MVKVTVLVAVYNAEPYLAECIESLGRQTLSDIQIVCVDDASTDGSLALLQSFADEDPRIEVVHLDENQGQAHARNEGLKRARGEYVCMLDADDTYSVDALDKAVEAFGEEDVDVVLFEVSMDYPDRSEIYPMPPFRFLTGDEAFRLSLTWQIHGIYMVRAAIHRRYPYDETCRLYSDDNTTRLHYFSARRVGRCKGVYHYRQHTHSATHRVSVRRFDYLKANESMKRSLVSLNVSPDVLALYENHRWLNLVGVYMFYHVHSHQLPPAEASYGLSELKRVWQGIDRSMLDRHTTRKFGYRPMSSWVLFRVQEWLYFTIRGFLGKNY